MVFPWSLNDSKSSQVPRTLLSIPADFNNTLVWMVSTRPLIFMGLKELEIIIIILLFFRVSLPAFAVGFSLESE